MTGDKVDLRESRQTREALAQDSSALAILRDSRRRIRAGSLKAAQRMDRALAAVQELLAADRDYNKARALMSDQRLSNTERMYAATGLRAAIHRREAAIAAMGKVT